MKIAVCYSCQLRGDYNSHIPLVREALPGASFYFTTWNTETNIPNWIHKTYPQPELHYNPAIENASTWPIEYMKWIKNRMAYHEDWKHRSKQILAHALVVKDFADDYDVIVRVRYDTIISKKMIREMKTFCQKAYDEKRAYGFFVPRARNIDARPELEVDTPNIIAKGAARDKGHVTDHMIIHRRDIFDCDRAWQLHEDKKLRIAEYGWFQLLSEPYGDTHINHRGYAGLEAKKL